jgi:phospho-N-acetylmuramoyl-pentapeptide-transferase
MDAIMLAGLLLAVLLLGYGLSVATFPWFIRQLRRLSAQQTVREDGPQHHQSKTGTPTGGGLWFVLLSIFVVLLSLLAQPKTTIALWPLHGVVLLSWLGLAGLGLADDGLKILKRHNAGLGAKAKLTIQLGIGLVVGMVLMLLLGYQTTAIGPWVITLGWGYPLLAALVVTATSNAVNLTDGLDGLAAGTSAMTLFWLVLVCVMKAHPLAVWPVAVGVCVCGFLNHNRYPAKVFMGDTGSLALGGIIATLALITRTEWLLLGAGLVFVLEALSVIMQVVWFKRTGKRLLRMAPWHHHLELGGLSEQQVVRRLYFVQLAGLLLATLALTVF